MDRESIRSLLEQTFPQLRDTQYEITSPSDRHYNCIAWALGENQRWVWPSRDSQWPIPGDHAPTLEAFVAAFRTRGFEICRDTRFQQQVERIAIYVSPNGMATHAAREVGDTRWTSKCGESVDIEHELHALESALYGKVKVLMSRPATPKQG